MSFAPNEQGANAQAPGAHAPDPRAVDALRAAVQQALAQPAWSEPDMGLLSGLPLAQLTADSREVAPGTAFAAFPGVARDGRAFIPDAIGRGAAAVLWDADGFRWSPDWRIPNAGIPQLQSAIGPIASEVYGRPSAKLWVAGVTGTNGKTSCSTWVAQALDKLGRKAALVGTLGHGLVDQLEDATHTTPDAVRLQRLLAEFRQQGADCVAMEASSHGLAQGRTHGVAFDVALFTNLSRDHLDYHGDMANYGAAKAKLFGTPGLRHAVVNIDDPFGALLAQTLAQWPLAPRPLSLTTYGIGRGALAGEHLQLSAGGIRMEVNYRGEQTVLQSPLLGAFNAHNLLGVIGVLLSAGVALADAVRVAGTLLPVAGRLQQIGGAGRPLVVIDYAHTPDALDKVLKTLRPLVTGGGRLICVFGCGGDRDRGKRPLMGAAAVELADAVVITSDNPRTESPGAIIDDVVVGIKAGISGQDYEVIEDRQQAIFHAIAMAVVGDVVLIAGKGHETYQEIHGVRHPFSDAEVAARALSLAARS